MSLSFFRHLIVVLVLILQINKIHSAGKFYTTTENKHYYVEDDEKYSWYDSLIECLKLNMTLTAIESDTEQQALVPILNGSKLWLGGLMVPNTRHFVWISTGKPFQYTNWFQGNPDFINNCVLSGLDIDNDIRCTFPYGYICEQPQHPQIVTETDERKLQEDIVQLNENLRIEIQERQNLQQELKKQKELAQNLQERLQQINDTKLEMQEKKVNLQQELQKLVQELVNGEQNLQQVSQKPKDSQHLTEQQLQHHKEYEAKQQNDEKNKSYLNLFFSNIQNAYFFQNSR